MGYAADFRTMRIPLTHGNGAIPAAGFGTLIADPELTRTATHAALEAGYRHLDCAERYRNEVEIGEALQPTAGALGSRARISSSPASCGTRTIDPKECARRSMEV